MLLARLLPSQRRAVRHYYRSVRTKHSRPAARRFATLYAGEIGGTR